MDAKDLKTDSAVGARNDGSNKYGQGSITCDRNKPYQEVGSNSLGKVDVQTTRPCAVIGPDRVVAPVAADVYHKKPPDQWLHPEQSYRRPPDYPLKMTDFQSPTRNISPRQTFQENMQRIMVPPTYNSMKLNGDSAVPDSNVSLPKNKLNVPTDSKYCEVPYNISPLTGEPKSYKNVDISVSISNPTVNQSAPYLWPATSVQQSRPYGASEFYPYADYTSCNGARTMPNSRPHRLASEETPSPYPERYFADSNVRFKPYPTIKDGYPQQRYECMSNYSNSYHPPPYPPPRYDLLKPVVPHMYSAYPQIPVKYIDNRMAEPGGDGYQRSNPPPNYSVAFHNQFIHPAYGPVPGNCVQNKMFSYPPDVSIKQSHMTKLAYENNKVYTDFDIRNKNYGIPEHYYRNEMNRVHSSKGQVMLSKHPPPNAPMTGHPYYRNSQFPNYDHNAQIKNPDYSLNMTNPIMRFTPHFSPNTSMSPLEPYSFHGTIQDENIYLGQKPVGSIRNADIRRIKTDIYGRYGTGLHRNSISYLDHKAPNSSKDKKNIDVRQFLQQWNDDDENHETSNSKQDNTPNSNEKNQTNQNTKNHDELYVLGLVNVPSEELSKYEHIQKISKLPDNIKGYNSLELLNQFEEAIEISNLNSNATATGKMCDVQAPTKQLPVQRATVPPQPRPVSPLDVEAKISQSVIHKEVGCNFEIKPCSPKMLNVDVAAPVQTVLDERVIEKLANPHGIKSPISKTSSNIISFSLPKSEDNQINSMHAKLKNPSCKLTNQFSSDDFIPATKSNYSLNDLEGNSGVCLASLPRLDNEIELNFPEVNQQFIDANKPESSTFVDSKSNSDYQQSLEGSPLKELCLSTHDSSSYPKLSKYRKIKKIDNDSAIEVHFPIQAMRTDSVIIKNEAAKESNLNSGFEKLLESTSSFKYEEAGQQSSSPAMSTKSDRCEEKQALIESLFETQETSNDVIIDFSVNKSNSSPNANNENSEHDFDTDISDSSSTQVNISGQKTLDSLISDIYSQPVPDKLYSDVMTPVHSKTDDNILNPIGDMSIETKMYSKPTEEDEEKEYNDNAVIENITNIPIKSEISQFLIDKQIPDSEMAENSKTSNCLTEEYEKVQDRKLLNKCDNEIEVKNSATEHTHRNLSKPNSTVEKIEFEVSNNETTPAESTILNDLKATKSQENSSWSKKDERLEVVKITINSLGATGNPNEPVSFNYDEPLCLDEISLKNNDIVKTNYNEMDKHNSEIKTIGQPCIRTESNKKYPIFNISENICKSIDQSNESTNLETQFSKKSSKDTAVENGCDKNASNKAILENICEEEISVCKSDTNINAIGYMKHSINETLPTKTYSKESVSHSYGNTADSDKVVIENTCHEIGVPSSNMNLNFLHSSSSDDKKFENTFTDEVCVSNNKTNAYDVNTITNFGNQALDHKVCDKIIKSNSNTNTTEYTKKLPIAENNCEKIDVSDSEDLNTTDLNINECNKTILENTSEEICVTESNTIAHMTKKASDANENKQEVEGSRSFIDQNTTMSKKNNAFHRDSSQIVCSNKSTETTLSQKTDITESIDYKTFQKSGDESVCKQTPNTHNTSATVPKASVPVLHNPILEEKENCCIQMKSDQENSNEKYKTRNMDLEDTDSRKTMDNHTILQKAYNYRKICEKSIPIKQFSPWVQKLMLCHEGVISLPVNARHCDKNDEDKNMFEKHKSASPCDLLPNTIDLKVPSVNEKSEKSMNNIYDLLQQNNSENFQSSVLTLKEIASRVLQNSCHTTGTDYATKASPDSIMNDYVPSEKNDSEKYTDRPTCALKRSLSDSALNVFDDHSCTAGNLWPKRRKSIQKKLLGENYCQLLQNHRRNSISTIFNEDISFCIFLDDNCIITEEVDEIDRNDMEEAFDSENEKLCEDFKNMGNVSNPIDDVLNIEEKPTENCWIEDVACVETVVTDNIEENEGGVNYTKEENHGDIVSLPKHDAISNYDLEHNEEFAINLTSIVKKNQYDKQETVLVNAPCQASQMGINKLSNTEDADRQTLENILTGTDSITTINHDFAVSNTNKTFSTNNNILPISKPLTEISKGNKDVSDTHTDLIEKYKMEQTQYDIIHSCESSVDNVFTYQDKEDSTRYSTSPEVSSTTSEDRCSSILLKITNYKGSIISELSNSNDTRRISCKYTENNDYNKSNKSTSNRTLITKAAQKYIPPLSESIPDLKVKLPLPPHSLLKFKDLKMAKEYPKIDPILQKRTNIDPSLPKKIKPKFEDVLKSIDEIQIKMHKEKSKKIKKCIPKVVIKKSENGSHYTSSQNNELSDPDLTGRKWQPWVIIERNKLVDNMVTKKKTKAIFNHRKKEFVLQDSFRKYKSVSSAKFVISQPKVDKLSQGQLKYTIKLKHSY